MEVKKICGIFAVATMMLSTFFVTSCNSEDDFDFGPDSQYSLAERKMTRATENGEKPSKPITNNTQLIVSFSGVEVNCYGWMEGYEYVGKVTVGGNIYLDTLTNKYSGIINSVSCSAQTMGDASASISNVTGHSAIISASFEGSEGKSAGITFTGSRAITY